MVYIALEEEQNWYIKKRRGCSTMSEYFFSSEWVAHLLEAGCTMNPLLANKIFKGVLILEAFGLGGAYMLYYKMDTSQGNGMIM